LVSPALKVKSLPADRLSASRAFLPKVLRATLTAFLNTQPATSAPASNPDLKQNLLEGDQSVSGI
jgi:hypothetical protein